MVERQVANSVHGAKTLSNGLTISGYTWTDAEVDLFREKFANQLEELPQLEDDWTRPGKRWFIDGIEVTPQGYPVRPHARRSEGVENS